MMQNGRFDAALVAATCKEDSTLLGRGDVSQAIIYIFELSAKAVPVKFQWAGAAIEDEDVHAFEQQFIGM